MTASRVNGGGSRARAGARALLLLAAPLNRKILRALSESPKRLVDLRREAGSPAQTTMRAHLRELEKIGAVAKYRRDRFPGALEYQLEAAGIELLYVDQIVGRWLRGAPEGAFEIDSDEARASIKALVGAWSATMLRALAARPMSLTELDRTISSLTYPSLERRLSAMRLVGQVTACPGGGQGTPYQATPWLRRGIAPIAAAARWERKHIPSEAAPVTRIDTEAAFLMALPVLQLDPNLSGSCRVGVEMRNGKERRLVGAIAHVHNGRVASCTVRLEDHADAWATGSIGGWLQAVVAAEINHLELGGDQHLTRAVVEGLNRLLTPACVKQRVT